MDTLLHRCDWEVQGWAMPRLTSGEAREDKADDALPLAQCGGCLQGQVRLARRPNLWLPLYWSINPSGQR